MTRLSEINRLPTSVYSIPTGCKGVHESTLRAFHILEEVKRLLTLGTPSEVILELIQEMQAVPPAAMWVGNTFEGGPPSGDDWFTFLHQCQRAGVYSGLSISATNKNKDE